MPWRELKPMDLKVMFIADYLSGRLNFSQLCAAHSLNLKDISDCDLTRVTRAVHLLMREGCAVLDVIQARALQREEGFKATV